MGRGANIPAGGWQGWLQTELVSDTAGGEHSQLMTQIVIGIGTLGGWHRWWVNMFVTQRRLVAQLVDGTTGK